MEGKKWYESKTMWFGIFYGVLTLAPVVLNELGYSGYTPSGEYQTVLGLAAAVIVIMLRKVTSRPIE